MKDLDQRIAEANRLLAPYAVPNGGVLGREHGEEADATRFPFQRDRDRIIHTQAFRRLKGKTQVFIPSEGDHHRTRLTHTMEVAQLSRDIARTLSLNEDLAECIALAHDLGHPPFGHAGEDALNRWLHGHGGHFEHNEQSLRIVTLLEEHCSRHPGLNLNREVLEGLRKHTHVPDRAFHSLEAEIVDIADSIAYLSHDAEDGVNNGLLDPQELRQVDLIAEAEELAGEHGTALRGRVVHLLVTDLYAETGRRIEERGIARQEDFHVQTEPVAAFSPAMHRRVSALHTFLRARVYEHPAVAGPNGEGMHIVLRLCEALERAPTEKILLLQRKTASTLPEAVKDYVAGMTDQFAAASQNLL